MSTWGARRLQPCQQQDCRVPPRESCCAVCLAWHQGRGTKSTLQLKSLDARSLAFCAPSLEPLAAPLGTRMFASMPATGILILRPDALTAMSCTGCVIHFLCPCLRAQSGVAGAPGARHRRRRLLQVRHCTGYLTRAALIFASRLHLTSSQASSETASLATATPAQAAQISCGDAGPGLLPRLLCGEGVPRP